MDTYLTELEKHIYSKGPFYKYQTINDNLIDSLKNSYLWFSDPTTFNDPFDCYADVVFRKDTDFINYIKKKGQEIERTNFKIKAQKKAALERVKNAKNIFSISKNKEKWEGMMKEFLRKDIKSYGICCFSSTNDNILMWSHYSDSHKGVVIEYDRNQDPKFFLGPVKVDYSEVYPLIYYTSHSPIDLAYLAIFKKYTDWKYENEVRLLKMSNGKHPINPKSVKSIIFGMDTSDEDINKVIDSIENNQYDHVALYKAARKPGLFGIDIVDLE